MHVTKAYSETSLTSKIVLFAKIVNDFPNIFVKSSILDVRLGSTKVLNKKMNVFFDEDFLSTLK